MRIQLMMFQKKHQMRTNKLDEVVWLMGVPVDVDELGGRVFGIK